MRRREHAVDGEPKMTIRRRCALAWSLVFLAPQVSAQQLPATGAVSGVVVTDEGAPLADAIVRVTPIEGGQAREAVSDALGAFTITALPSGLYSVAARRIGRQPAELPFLRILPGQTTAIRIALTTSPTRLSTVTVRATAATIDVRSPEVVDHIALNDVKLVPMGRDAMSLLDLVPGARKGFVWGAGGDAANNYQLDGVAMNHPGSGGDPLSLSIDWIEALDVRGLGAGAENGNFQGGIINAVTRTGSNTPRRALRAYYAPQMLTASSIHRNEEGTDPLMRRELSGEISGPLVRDRLFYFAGARLTNREFDVRDLTTPASTGFRAVKPAVQDARGIAKLTLLPGVHDRLDALFGYTGLGAEHAQLNGVDGVSASRRNASTTAFYAFDWAHGNPASSLDLRIAGFTSSETQLGYAGDSTPSVQIYRLGREPAYQNSPFNDRLAPRGVSGNATWKKRFALLGGENQVVIGVEYARGWWRHDRTRNGGLTWRPYEDAVTHAVDAANASGWTDEASDWGGEIRLQSTTEDQAVFVQDYFEPISSLTITPGLRYGRWQGWLTPPGGTRPVVPTVDARAADPRIGVVWDVSHERSLVLKAHWGRYHQGMSSLFFDRATGGDAYTNQRFYFQGPHLTSSTTVFTPAQRDSSGAFGTYYAESILNEAGRVVNYRQPFVDQAVLGLEKAFGPNWKLVLTYTNRVNKDIVGLVDRNLARNYSKLTDISVRDAFIAARVLDQNGAPLVLPIVWVANNDLASVLSLRAFNRQQPVAGYTFADIARLTFNPDRVLTTVEGARRRMDQLSVSLRTEHPGWNALASLTTTRLVGNVAGLTGFSAGDTSFTAGPAVRPNEAINDEGRLPGYPVLESKLWLSGELPFGLRGGAFATFTLGEYYEPIFQMTPRFKYSSADGNLLEDDLFRGVAGQTLLLEQRGSRKSQARANLDLRLERRFVRPTFECALTADLFNALGSDAILIRNGTVVNQVLQDPTSVFGAPRQRVAPRSLQLGIRVAN